MRVFFLIFFSFFQLPSASQAAQLAPIWFVEHCSQQDVLFNPQVAHANLAYSLKNSLAYNELLEKIQENGFKHIFSDITVVGGDCEAYLDLRIKLQLEPKKLTPLNLADFRNPEDGEVKFPSINIAVDLDWQSLSSVIKIMEMTEPFEFFATEETVCWTGEWPLPPEELATDWGADNLQKVECIN